MAWVAFSGRFAIQLVSALLVPYSEATAAVSVTNRAIWDTSAADLVNGATAMFRETEAKEEDVQALLQNPQYSLSVLWALATGIQRLKGVPERNEVVVFAAAALTQDDVNFVAGAVNMLARYHEAVAALAQVSAPGPGSVDYVSWIEPLGRAVERPEFQAPPKVEFLSGRASRLAHRNLTARGCRIDETYSIAAER